MGISIVVISELWRSTSPGWSPSPHKLVKLDELSKHQKLCLFYYYYCPSQPLSLCLYFHLLSPPPATYLGLSFRLPLPGSPPPGSTSGIHQTSALGPQRPLFPSCTIDTLRVPFTYLLVLPSRGDSRQGAYPLRPFAVRTDYRDRS